MLALKIIALVAVLFLGGLATSFAEFKFKYSLYKTIFKVK